MVALTEWSVILDIRYLHDFIDCVKRVRIRFLSGPCFPVFSSNGGKYGPEKLGIRTLFTFTEEIVNGKKNVFFLHKIKMSKQHRFML